MQQSTTEVELQEDSNSELSSKELVDSVIGLDNYKSITDENQTDSVDDEPVDSDNLDESVENEDGENNFYSTRELFALIKNNQEVDESRLSDDLKEVYADMVDYKKSLQGDYTKKTQKVAEERKTFEEQLKAFEQEKEERNRAERLADATKLSVQEVIDLRNDLKKQFRFIYGYDYDESIQDHKEIFEDAFSVIASKKKAEKEQAVNLFEIKSRLQERYGSYYNQLDDYAAIEIQELPSRQEKLINQAIREGKVDIVLSFYDHIKHKYIDNKQNQQEPQQQQAQQQIKKEVKVPPTSFNKNSVTPKESKVEWKNFI